jgi:large subunit ribosomal protein L23
MALFGSKKKVEETSAQGGSASGRKPEAIVSTKSKTNTVSNAGSSVAHVLKSPRITEKASMHQSIGVYTFDVAISATKTQIAEAIRSTYKVSPRKIRIVQIPAKQTRSTRTGKRGVKTGGKKAYVYLTSGETITIS